jgi:hypothetical protein
MRISQFSGVAAAVVAAAFLAGCAGPSPAAAPTSTPTSTPSASPAPAVRPEQLLDGDCAALFDADEVSAAIGGSTAPRVSEWDLDPEYIAPAQLGGMRCLWGEGAEPDSAGLSVVVLPTSTLPDPADPTPECTEGYGCSFTATSGAWSLFGVLVNAEAPIATTETAYQSLAASFTAKVAPEAQPKPYQPEGVWPVVTDCATLDAQRLVGLAIGAPGAEPGPLGGDAESNAGIYSAGRSTGITSCGWWAESDGAVRVRLNALPGGAWIEDEVAAQPGAVPAGVPGSTSAYTVGDRLHVFAAAVARASGLDSASPPSCSPSSTPSADRAGRPAG